MASFVPDSPSSKDGRSNFLTTAIFDPPIPAIKGFQQLLPGDLLMIFGFIPKKSSEFSISMKAINTGPISRTSSPFDVPIEITVKSAKKVVIGCNVNGKQDHGSSVKCKQLKNNKAFACSILVGKEFFKLAFNDLHFKDFKNHCPKRRINALSIDGQVYIRSVRVQTGLRTPHILPNRRGERRLTYSVNLTHHFKEEMAIAVERALRKGKTEVKLDHRGEYELMLPVFREIPDGVQLGTAIYVCGKPHRLSETFSLYLRESVNADNIALQLSVNMREQQLVCSHHFEDLNTTNEIPLDSVYEFPFGKKMHFDLLIVCDEKDFKISINNVHLLTYQYYFRNISQIDELEISGDLEIHSLLIDRLDVDST